MWSLCSGSVRHNQNIISSCSGSGCVGDNETHPRVCHQILLQPQQPGKVRVQWVWHGRAAHPIPLLSLPLSSPHIPTTEKINLPRISCFHADKKEGRVRSSIPLLVGNILTTLSPFFGFFGFSLSAWYGSCK